MMRRTKRTTLQLAGYFTIGTRNEELSQRQEDCTEVRTTRDGKASEKAYSIVR